MGNECRFSPHSQFQILCVVSDFHMCCADPNNCNLSTLRQNPTQRQIRDEYDYHSFGNGRVFVLQFK